MRRAWLAVALLLAGCAAGDERRAWGDPRAEPAAETAAATGGCRPLLPSADWEEGPKHSCWHRVWEVPAALVVYPVAFAIGAAVITAPIWGPVLLLRR